MKIIFTAMLLLFCGNAIAQSSYLKYVKRPGKFEYAQRAAALPDGSAVLASWNQPDSLLHLTKVNMLSGALLWEKEYRLTGNTLDGGYLYSLQYTSDNHLLLGMSLLESLTNSGFNNTNLCLLAFDTAGTLLWNLSNSYGHEEDGLPAGEISPGRYMAIMGKSYSARTIQKAELVKLNGATGALLASKEYAFGSYLSFYNLAAANNRSFVVTGVVPSFYNTPFHYDLSLAKMDTSLNVLWTHAYRDTIFNGVAAIAPYTNGGWLILGTGFSDFFKENGTLVMAVDSNGAPLWAKQYVDTGRTSGGYVLHCNGTSLAATSDGNYLMSGQYDFLNGTNISPAAFVMKIDASGNMLFVRGYGSTAGTANPYDNACAAIDLGAGNYFFAGRTGYNGLASTLYGLDNPARAPRASCFGKSPGIVSTNILPQIRDTVITLAAGAYTSPLAGVFWTASTVTFPTDTICYNTESVSLQAAAGAALAVYPNPSRGAVRFEWKGGTLPRNARLGIYDVSGRLVYTMPFSSEKLEMESSNLRAGIYYYTLSAGEGIIARGKLVAE
jgi:hypothetical protein